MLDFIVEAWDRYKDDLRAAYARAAYQDDEMNLELCSYQDIFKFTLKHLHLDWFRLSDLTIVDYGDYQGTLIFIIPYDTYQPGANETYYTIVEYGSCSGCDLLQNIQIMTGADQINAFMNLSLNMLQRLKTFE